jgi:hypothetical protein
LSLDPLQKLYPELTPYQFSSNSPIAHVDLDGRESEYYLLKLLEKKVFGTNHIEKIEEGFVKRSTETIKQIFKGDGSKIPDVVKRITDFRLATTDPSVAKRNLINSIEVADLASKVFINGIKNTIVDTKELMKRALKGDDEAIGGLSFEVLMFFTPGGEESKGFKFFGRITGDEGVILAKARKAVLGDLATEAELRVAKSLRGEGKNIHFIDADAGHAAGTGTFDYIVDGVKTDVKRLSGIGSRGAKNVAEGIEQVGANGQIIIVRPADSKFTLQQYEDFYVNGFKPKQPGVTIKVVNESELPSLLGKKK